MRRNRACGAPERGAATRRLTGERRSGQRAERAETAKAGERRRGTLIALEGIDGCGKSSQARRLVDELRRRGYDAVGLREPGDSEYGRRLRRIFVQGRHVSPREEVELFLADRRIDVLDNIVPALERGAVVVMDRYYLSSIAYQGSLGVDPEWIRAENERIAPRPDLTVVLDIDVATARERIRAARGATNAFEDADYLERVRAAYLAAVDGRAVVRVNAARAPDEVFAALWRRVRERLPDPPPPAEVTR